MSQLDYAFTNGQVGTPDPGATIVSLPNPIALGTSNVDVNTGTTDGTYTLGLYRGAQLLATASAVAVSLSAAQIAAALTAAVLAEPTFSSYVKSAAVHTTVETLITYWDPTMNLSVAILADPSTALTVTNTAPARTTVALGEIIQSNGSGGWTQTYTDASLALGAVCRSADYLLPIGGEDPGGGQSPCELSLVQAGALNVPVVAGTTVLRGQKVAYSPTTKQWHNTVTGTYVLVEGAQWQTSGTGVQKVLLRFPSEN